jgi:hypothetical protein
MTKYLHLHSFSCSYAESHRPEGFLVTATKENSSIGLQTRRVNSPCCKCEFTGSIHRCRQQHKNNSCRYAHLCALDEGDLALPVHFLGGFLRPRCGAVNDGVDAHQGCGEGGRVCEICLNCRGTPIPQEICRVLSWSHYAPHLHHRRMHRSCPNFSYFARSLVHPAGW